MNGALEPSARRERIDADEQALSLTDGQIAAFHENGYCPIPAITTTDELASLVPLYDGLFERRVGFDEGNYFDFVGEDDRNPALPQLMSPSAYEPRLKSSRLFRNCAAVAEQLLGPAAEFVFDHAIMKPAGGPATAFHQDQAFWRARTQHRAISFWITLQEANEANGCLRFIPGSNRGPLHEHRSIDDDCHKHALEAIGVAEEAAVACPLPEGGATVHHWLTCHGAYPNVTAAPRRAYMLGFGVHADRPIMRGEYPWNRRKVTERERRYRASLKPWQRLKQDLRTRLYRWGFF